MSNKRINMTGWTNKKLSTTLSDLTNSKNSPINDITQKTINLQGTEVKFGDVIDVDNNKSNIEGLLSEQLLFHGDVMIGDQLEQLNCQYQSRELRPNLLQQDPNDQVTQSIKSRLELDGHYPSDSHQIDSTNDQMRELVNLLGLSLPLPDGVITLTEAQSKKLEPDKDGNTQLLTAASNGNKEAIDLIIRCGVDVNYQNPKTQQRAIDIVWEKGDDGPIYYDCMLVLLESDSNFPDTFTLDALDQDDNIPDKLKTFVGDREQLHKWIENKELEEVSSFVSNNKLSKFLNRKNQPALETAVVHASVEVVAALLGLPSALPTEPITLTEIQRSLLQQVNQEGDKLLSIAAKHGKSDNVDFLARCGLDVNYQNAETKRRAIDLSWDEKHYEVVLVLLQADSDLPSGFNKDILNDENDKYQAALKQFFKKRDELHELINAKNELGKIKDFIRSNKESKFYLNSKGQSAVWAAITSKKYEFYAFFKSIGNKFKNQDEEKCIDVLNEGDKYKLKNAMIPFFPSSEQAHIFFLISKSRPFKENKGFDERVKDFYEKLDAIPEVSNILKVVAYSDYLDIVFDFHNENIKDVNPTASDATKGITDYKEGRIYIAAGMETSKLLGTLAHELTHLAMQAIYENDCNPYKSDDSKLKFEGITENISNQEAIKTTINQIQDNLNTIDDSQFVVLARAFRYPKNEQQSELIVRIPHILAQYGEAGRVWLREQVPGLLEYYGEDVTPACNSFIGTSFSIKPRNRIKLLNQGIGELNRIKEYNIGVKNAIDLTSFFENQQKNILVLRTKSTFVSSLNIYQTLKSTLSYSSDDQYLMLELNHYETYNEEVNKSFYGQADLLVVVHSSDSVDNLSGVLKNLSDLFSQKPAKKVVFIVQEKHVNVFEEELNKIRALSDKYLEEEDRKFTFNDFEFKPQDDPLGKNLILFQGKEEKTSLNQLIHPFPVDIIDVNTFVDLVRGKEIKIGSKPSGISDLEGAYAELSEKVNEVNKETLKINLIDNSLEVIYVISGISIQDRDGARKIFIKDLELLQSTVTENDKRIISSKINILEDPYFIPSTDKTIQLVDSGFKERNFKDLCNNHSGKQVYWIKWDESRFTLQKIYNPDFYTPRQFNKVVIKTKFKNQYETLTQGTEDKFVFSGIDDHNNLASLLGLQRSALHEGRIFVIENQDGAREKFNELTNTVHWLDVENNGGNQQIIWCDSKGSGSLDNLGNLRKYLYDNKEQSEISLENQASLLQFIEDKHKKVVIIADDPGMGKSTTLVKLYQSKYGSDNKSKLVDSHWVINVNLRKHLKAIKDDTDAINIPEFLSEVDKNLEHDLAPSLLKLALYSTKTFKKPLLITFDGFDEVLGKEDREKVIKLLKYLKNNTNAKFWVTTRLEHRPQLGNDLFTFAVTFKPLDGDAQKNFIKKFFKNRLKLLLSEDTFTQNFGKSDEEDKVDPLRLLNKNDFKNIFRGDNEVISLLSSNNNKDLVENFGKSDEVKDHLRSLNKNELAGIFSNHEDKEKKEKIGDIRMWLYTEAFIEKMQSVFKKDISRFIGTPLQLYLLLGSKGSIEAFKNWAESRSDSMPDLYYLGENILKVYKNFIDGKYETYFKKVGIVQEAEKKEKKFIFKKYCKELAKVNRKIGHSESKLLKNHEDMVLSAGLIQPKGDGLGFIHPTFEEYFASAIYMHWIEKESDLPNPNKQKFLLKEILMNDNNYVIRSFINLKLEKITIPDKDLQQYGDIFKKLWQQQPNPLIKPQEGTILHIATTTGKYRNIR